MPAKRGRGILNFGFLSDPFSVSAGRIPPLIPPDVVRGMVYTRTSITGITLVRESVTGLILSRQSFYEQMLAKESLKSEVTTRSSLQGVVTTKSSGKKEQEI